jgi:hypothetical protein
MSDIVDEGNFVVDAFLTRIAIQNSKNVETVPSAEKRVIAK